MKEIQLGGVRIGGSKTVIIAEIADCHNGSLETAKQLVDAAKAAGADVAKFQLHLPDEEMVPGSIQMWDGPLYDILKRNLFTPEMHAEIMAYCKQVGIEYLCTPFCPRAVDVLNEMGVSGFKTGSGELTNLVMQRKIAKISAQTGKPAIVSTGMSTFEEIAETVKIYEQEGAKDNLILTNCTSEYPPNDYSHANLGLIPKLRDTFGVIVGQSDHTTDNYTTYAAVSLGAKVIEKHFTLSRNQKGPDHFIALEPQMLALLVAGVRKVEVSLGAERKVSAEEQVVRDWAHHSVVVARDIAVGETLSLENLTVKRPGSGIPARYLDKNFSEKLLGKIATRALTKDTILQWSDVGEKPIEQPGDANKPRKIAIIAGSRGEYGYYRPIIKQIDAHPNLDYAMIVSNMHVLDSFGSSINEIKKDGLKIHASVHNTFDGYNRITMAKSLSVFMMQLPELLDQMGADIILLAGDRGEQLIGAITGLHLHIPVAHIQAGELSGNIDGMARHAITKFSHIHFCANQDAAERVLKMGEEPHRVYNVGAPMLDELVEGFLTPPETIYKQFNLDPTKPIVLLVHHSVTEEFEYAAEHAKAVIDAVATFGYQTIVILNNSDAGSKVLRNTILANKKPFMQIVPNLKRQDYVGLLNVASVMVGNSSSGILEAPTFKLPAVNIGNRERGRLQSTNVINVDYNKEAIIAAIQKALSPEFRAIVDQCVNPYGDGQSSKRIVEVLANVPIDDKLLVKNLTY